MGVTTKGKAQLYTEGASIDANYGPWASTSAYEAWVTNDMGLAVRDGVTIAVKAADGKITKYVRENGAWRVENISGGENYVILNNNLAFADQIDAEGNVYEIRDTFDLDGETVALPTGAVLVSRGGVIINGTLDCTNAKSIDDAILALTDESLTLINPSFSRSVNYRMFGAVLDGVTDDYEPIKACHDFANKYNVNVYQSDGSIYIEKGRIGGGMMNGEKLNGEAEPIYVRTDTDISGCKLVCYGVNQQATTDTKNSRKDLYVINEDSSNAFEQVSITSTINNNLVRGRNSIDGMKGESYEKKFYVIDATPDSDASDQVKAAALFGYRGMDVISPCYRHECFTIISDGVLEDGQLLFDYKDVTTTKLYAKSINTKPITFKAPLIVFDGQNDINVFRRPAITCLRNNTTLELQGVETINVGNFDADGAFALVSVTNCFNISLSGEKGVNVGTRSDSSAKHTSYLLNGSNISGLKVEDVYLQKGWGCFETESAKDIYINRCVLNRVDNHWVCGNMYITNTKIIGDKGFLNLGYGKGNVIVRDCEYLAVNTSLKSTEVYYLLNYRSDMGVAWEGNVVFDNVNVTVKAAYNSSTFPRFNYIFFYTDYKVNGVSSTLVPCITNNRIGSVSLRNIKVFNVVPCHLFDFRLNPNVNYQIDSIEFIGLDTRVYNQGEWRKCNVNSFITGNIQIDKIKMDDCKFYNDAELMKSFSDSTGGVGMYSNSVISIGEMEFRNTDFLVPMHFKFLGSVQHITAINSNTYIYGVKGDYYNCKVTTCSLQPSNAESINDVILLKYILGGQTMVGCKLYVPEGYEGVGYRFLMSANSDDYVENTYLFGNVFVGDKTKINQFSTLGFDILEHYNSAHINDAGEGHPIVNATYCVGKSYFNTELHKPLWYTGSGWVDATGADVSLTNG